jgi:hypothetical protein
MRGLLLTTAGLAIAAFVATLIPTEELVVLIAQVLAILGLVIFAVAVGWFCERLSRWLKREE